MAEPEQPDTDLITVAEARRECNIADTDHKADDDLVVYVSVATSMIESETNRKIIARDANTHEEAHEILTPSATLYTKERPVRTLDWVKVAGSLIDMKLLYFDADSGRVGVLSPVRRHPLLPGSFGPLGADFPEDVNFRFGTSFTAYPVGLVTLKYLGGFASRADVPGEIRRACLTLVARQYREMVRKSQGLSSESSSIGSTTKFDPTAMPDDIKKLLRSQRSFAHYVIGAKAAS